MSVPSPEHDGMKCTVWVIGLLGLLPLLWAMLGATLHVPMFGFSPVNTVLTYGAIMLSFLGGILWMCAVNLTGNRNLSQWGLWMSIVPALAAWTALLIGQHDGLLILMAGYVGLLSIESAFARMALMPVWFWGLQWKINAMVIVLLGIIWWCIPSPSALAFT
jgi:hypothetical protein